MQLLNYSYITDGLIAIKKPLARFITHSIQNSRIYRNNKDADAWWKNGVIDKLSSDIRKEYSKVMDEDVRIEFIDIAVSVTLLEIYYNEIFIEVLGVDVGIVRAWAQEIRAIRHSVSHQKKDDLSYEETKHGLEAMKMLMEKVYEVSEIGGDAIIRLDELLEDLERKKNEAEHQHVQIQKKESVDQQMLLETESLESSEENEIEQVTDYMDVSDEDLNCLEGADKPGEDENNVFIAWKTLWRTLWRTLASYYVEHPFRFLFRVLFFEIKVIIVTYGILIQCEFLSMVTNIEPPDSNVLVEITNFISDALRYDVQIDTVYAVSTGVWIACLITFLRGWRERIHKK